ncbi:MAG: MerR family DNA-binding protein [Betaproteobacteria bacterium]|nr:MerR family DNA-binding protein [Betaproteobacteria bacterium]
MNIGQAAEFAGVSVKTARYYCDIGLIPVGRGESGYRIYSQKSAADLRFVVRARAAGFSLAECRMLINYWQNNKRVCADVKKLVLAHIERINNDLENLKTMRDSLAEIAADCTSDKKTDCPILDMLADK